MNVCAVQKPYLRILAISKVINDRRKKHYDFPINISPTRISLNVKFSFPLKNKISKVVHIS